MSTRRIYFVSPTNVADHRRGGASICSLAYLQAIAEAAQGAVTLVSPCRREEMPELPSGVDEVIAIPGRSMVSKVISLASGRSIDRLSPFMDRLLMARALRHSLFFMNSSRGGRFSRMLASRGIPSVTLFHNVEERFIAASVRNPVLLSLMRRAADRNDRDAFAFSACSIFLSGFDADLMSRRATQRLPGASVIRDGYFAPAPVASDPGPLPPPTGRDFIIACHLGVSQNVPGIVRFIERDWSACASRGGLGESRLIVAGAAPAPEIVDAARHQQRVEVIGDPSDATMRQLMTRSIACISTIESGSGIKVRVAEALRLGRPVIGTSHSFIGYERIDHAVKLVAEIGHMAPVLQSLAGDPDIAGLCSLARQEFVAKLSHDAGAARIREVLERLR